MSRYIYPKLALSNDKRSGSDGVMFAVGDAYFHGAERMHVEEETDGVNHIANQIEACTT